MGERKGTIALDLDEVETLLKGEKNVEADKRLGVIDRAGLSDEEIGRYLLLKIQTDINLGRYDHELVNRALAHFRYDKKAFGFARVKLLLGWMLSKQGKIVESREALNEAAATFLLIGRPEQAASAWNQIANDAVVGGNLQLAIEAYKQAQDLFAQSGNGLRARDIILNLAYVYCDYGRLNEARIKFQEYETECGREIDTDRQYNHSIADYYVQLGATADAQEHLVVASKCLGGSRRGMIVNRLILAKCHYFEGEFRLAIEAARFGLQLADEIGSDLRAPLRRWLADAYLDNLGVESARREIFIAQRLAQSGGQRVETGACCRTLGRVAMRLGQPDEARMQFEESIRILAGVESFYELARTRLVASSSSLFDAERSHQMKEEAVSYFLTHHATIPTVGVG